MDTSEGLGTLGTPNSLLETLVPLRGDCVASS